MENTLQEKLDKALQEDVDTSRYPFPMKVEVRVVDEGGPYPSAVLKAIIDESVAATIMFGWSSTGGDSERATEPMIHYSRELQNAWCDMTLELDPLVEVYKAVNLVEYLLHPSLTVRLYAKALQRRRDRENRI